MTLPAGWLGTEKNFLGLDEPWCHPESAGIYVLPAPYEHTSSYILGSDHGPAAIIEASQQVELYDETVGVEPYREWGGVATAVPLELESRVDGEAVDAIQAYVQPHVTRSRLVVTLTGEHTGALGAMRAHAKVYPDLCILQIDAHGDLRQAYQGNPYSHASVMARVVEDGLPLVQVGIRSISAEEARLLNSGIPTKIYWAKDIVGKTDWINSAIDNLTENVYLTIDIDGLDPSLVPTTGTPEPGGLGWYETLTLIRKLGKKRRVVGMDLVEYSYSENQDAPAFLCSKLVYKSLAYIFREETPKVIAAKF